MTYITARGNWYHNSWKGDISKSGGIATNIGIHFFDMLQWIFGNIQENYVHLRENSQAAGFLRFEKANVRWFLSINENDLPLEAKLQQQRTFRSMTIDNDTFEFSEGFSDLHTRSYEKILNNEGFSLAEARKAVVIAHDIRNNNIESLKGEKHSFLKK